MGKIGIPDEIMALSQVVLDASEFLHIWMVLVVLGDTDMPISLQDSMKFIGKTGGDFHHGETHVDQIECFRCKRHCIRIALEEEYIGIVRMLLSRGRDPLLILTDPDNHHSPW
jgi:hypothetical protein